MTFEEMLDHASARLPHGGHLTSGTRQRQVQLDDAALDARKDTLLDASPEVHDDAGRGLIGSGAPGLTASATAAAAPAGRPAPAPLTSPPPSLAAQMFTSRRALGGAHTQVTVLFTDHKGSMARLADHDPAEARQLLDPVLARLRAAVHRLPHVPLHGGIRDSGGGTRPPHHQPPLMQPHTPCGPDHPALVRAACAAPLRRTAARAPEMDPRDPRRVDDAEGHRRGHNDLHPVMMRHAKTHEPGPRGEAGQPRPRVTRHLARAGPVAHACAGLHQPHGAHRTGPGVRLRMGGAGAHLRSNLSAHSGDQRHGAHAPLLAWAGGHVPSLDEASETASPTHVS